MSWPTCPIPLCFRHFIDPMLLTASLPLLFINLLFFVSDLVHLVVSVQRPVAVMFQVSPLLPVPRHEAAMPAQDQPRANSQHTNFPSSGSATPLTRASQRNRPAKNPLRIISPAPTPHAVRPTVIFHRGNGPAPDVTLEPQFGAPTRKNSKRNLRSAMMSPVDRVHLV